MTRRIVPALLVVSLVSAALGCRDHPREPETAGVAPRDEELPTEPIRAELVPRVSDPSASEQPTIADTNRSPDALDPDTRTLLAHLTEARAVRARPISKRSLSLRLSLRGGRDAAFKPLLRDKPFARYEVAAFRLSRLLGLSCVPPSVMKRIPVDNFAWMLGEEHAEINEALREQADLDDRSGVWGATITWLDGLEPSALEGSAGMERVAQLLALDGPPIDREPLAAEVSSLVVFDYVTGNWDRFSGGNLFRERQGGRLILLDNNGAFARWSDIKQERMDRLLGLAFRFSRRLIAALRSLSPSEVERVLEQEPWHRQRRLLTRREVDLMLVRRDAILTRVDALVAEHGESRILAFP